MKIVRNKVSKVVVYLFNDGDPCVIADSGMTGVVIAADIFSDTHEVIEGVTAPANWAGNEWTYDGYWSRKDGGTVKEQKLAELAAYRYSKETAGITLSGMAIETNRESQALINGAWSFSQLNPAVLIDWKAESGWIQIDAATIAAIAGAVAAHVQSCFSTERIHAEAIAALVTSEEVQSYDITNGWPQ